MVETDLGIKPAKDVIIDQFKELGYETQQKTIETLNGPKEITEYTKSFLTYSFVNPDGSGEYPLLLNIDFTQQDDLYGSITEARPFIFNALADTLTSIRQKSVDKVYGHDQKSLVVDTDLGGLEHVEKVLEKLHVPGFNYKLDKLRNSTQGKILKELHFEISCGKHNDFLVGDKPNIHVVHSPIKEGTKGKEGYAPYEWKIKIDAAALLNDKDIIKRYNAIIEKHGLTSYKDGNSFVSTSSNSNLLKVSENIDNLGNFREEVLVSSNMPETESQTKAPSSETPIYIVSRVNIPGLVEISNLFESQSGSGPTTPQNPK